MGKSEPVVLGQHEIMPVISVGAMTALGDPIWRGRCHVHLPPETWRRGVGIEHEMQVKFRKDW